MSEQREARIYHLAWGIAQLRNAPFAYIGANEPEPFELSAAEKLWDEIELYWRNRLASEKIDAIKKDRVESMRLIEQFADLYNINVDYLLEHIRDAKIED